MVLGEKGGTVRGSVVLPTPQVWTSASRTVGDRIPVFLNPWSAVRCYRGPPGETKANSKQQGAWLPEFRGLSHGISAKWEA